MTPARTLGITLLAAAAVLSFSRTASALRGPPLLCHPFEIGDARSLPFGDRWNGPPAAHLTPQDLVDLTVEVLDESDDPVTHLETVRRVAISLAHGDEAPDASHARRLLQRLGKRAELARQQRDELTADGATPDAVTTRRTALAALDYGCALEAFSEAGVEVDDTDALLSWTELAARVLPDDGGVRLGAALAAFGRGRKTSTYEHLDRALVVAAGDALLIRNICNTMGPCLDAKHPDDLAKKVRAALGRA